MMVWNVALSLRSDIEPLSVADLGGLERQPGTVLPLLVFSRCVAG